MNKLKEIYKRDQLRSEAFARLMTNDPEGGFAKWSKKYLADLKKDMRYIKKYLVDYRRYPLNDETEVSAVFLVVQHADDEELWKYQVNFCDYYSKKGLLSRLDYAKAKDRHLVRYLKKPQLYGTQYVFDKDRNLYIREFKGDVKDVILRRKKERIDKIETFEESLKKQGLKLDDLPKRIMSLSIRD